MLPLLVLIAAFSPVENSRYFRPNVPFSEIKRAYADCLAAVGPEGLDRGTLKKRGWRKLKVTSTEADAPAAMPEILGRDSSFIMISLVTMNGENRCNVSASVEGDGAYQQFLAYLAGQLSQPDDQGKRTGKVDGRTVTVRLNGEQGAQGTVLVSVIAPEPK